MKNPHAQALGRLGKGKTSEAKKAAARRNGTAPVKPGSKPRGRPRKAPVNHSPMKQGTKANPLPCEDWSESFDAARERQRPLWCKVGEEIGKCFPSGRFEKHNA